MNKHYRHSVSGKTSDSIFPVIQSVEQQKTPRTLGESVECPVLDTNSRRRDGRITLIRLSRVYENPRIGQILGSGITYS